MNKVDLTEERKTEKHANGFELGNCNRYQFPFPGIGAKAKCQLSLIVLHLRFNLDINCNKSSEKRLILRFGFWRD